MRRLISLFSLMVWAAMPALTQETATAVMERFTVTAPSGYNIDQHTEWSPNGDYLAVLFEKRDEQHFVADTLWQIYAVPTGTLLAETSDFITWYPADMQSAQSHRAAQPHRALVRRLEDGAVMVIDLQSGNMVTAAPDSALNTPDARLALSPDGALLAVETTAAVQIYDAEDFTLREMLSGYRINLGADYLQNWDPTSTQLAVVPVDMVDVNLGPRHIWTIGGGISAPIYNMTNQLIWSPDGTRVAVPSDYTKIRVYDSTSGELLETIRGFVAGNQIYGLQWDGEYLLVQAVYPQGMGTSVYVWDFTQARFTFVDEHVDFNTAWIDDGELTIFEFVSGIRRIDLTTGAVIQETVFEQPITYHSANLRWGNSWQISPVKGGVTIHTIWSLNPLETVAVFQTKEGFIESWRPDGRFFASHHIDDSLIIWEILENGVG